MGALVGLGYDGRMLSALMLFQVDALAKGCIAQVTNERFFLGMDQLMTPQKLALQKSKAANGTFVLLAGLVVS